MMATGRHPGNRPIARQNTNHLVVFTDLDGTLLDHDTYDWSPAASSLDALRDRGVPVILISSKTRAELAQYRNAMALDHPVVAENGAAADVPAGALDGAWQPDPDAVTRSQLQDTLETLRGELGVRCRAFFELGVDGIMQATGLDRAQALLANTREASEPLLWQDTDAALDAFSAAAGKHGLRCVLGGRFVHLMGQTDKADAMQRLLGAYARAWSGAAPRSVALGDSPNDLGMLRAADVAVVIPGKSRERTAQMMDALADHPRVIEAPQPGPAGWHSTMQILLSELDTEYENVG